jgi:hypothetical protein
VIHPGQIAFLGQDLVSTSSAARTRPFFVQVMCWPLTDNAWAALTQSWNAIRALREGSMPLVRVHKGPQAPPSWIQGVAPKLSAPFRDNPAEESTLAAWISRAHVSIAIAVVEASKAGAKKAPDYDATVAECLTGYLDFLKFPAYEPFRLIVAGALPAAQRLELTHALTEARKRLREMPAMRRFPEVPIRYCNEGDDLIPMDFANLVASAINRFAQLPDVPNPLFDAIRPKLARVPRRIEALESRRRQ